MAAQWERSLEDPAGFLAEQMYTQGMRLTENKAFDNAISGTLELYQNIEGSYIRTIWKGLSRTGGKKDIRQRQMLKDFYGR